MYNDGGGRWQLLRCSSCSWGWITNHLTNVAFSYHFWSWEKAKCRSEAWRPSSDKSLTVSFDNIDSDWASKRRLKPFPRTDDFLTANSSRRQLTKNCTAPIVKNIFELNLRELHKIREKRTNTSWNTTMRWKPGNPWYLDSQTKILNLNIWDEWNIKMKNWKLRIQGWMNTQKTGENMRTCDQMSGQARSY